MKRCSITFLILVFTISICTMVVAGQQVGEMTIDEKEAAQQFRTRGYSPYADRG